VKCFHLLLSDTKQWYIIELNCDKML